MSPSNWQKDYVTQRVLAASPTELVRMLYEAAAQSVEQALEALRSGDILGRGRCVSKAIGILSELRLSLRREIAPAYCDTLSGLYSYTQRQLIRGHAEKSEGAFQEVARLLHTLLEGWTVGMQSLCAAQQPDGTAESGDSVRALGSSLPYEPAEARTSQRSWEL